MPKHGETYWSGRYRDRATGWDMGIASPPLTNYFDRLTDRDIRILIPGAGNAYEAEYLYRLGFKNVWVLDISPVPLNNLQKRVPDFPSRQLLCENFFSHSGQYDLIIEQTFFCALHPSERNQYVTQMLALLKPGGKLVGVLFDDPLNADHPPYGGNKDTYLPCFEPFNLLYFDSCYNSVPPRAGRELFLIAQKPPEQRHG